MAPNLRGDRKRGVGRHEGSAARSSHARSRPPKIGKKLRELRQAHKLTLEQVERQSGISKSMLSQIERGKANPTFGTLWQLTQSLDISIGQLVSKARSDPETSRSMEHLSVFTTPVVTSPDGKCHYRILNPRRLMLPIEWYDVSVEPGGAWRVNPHGSGSWEHLTCIVGKLTVEVGGEDVVVTAGETLRYSGELPHGLRNDSRSVGKAILVVIFGEHD